MHHVQQDQPAGVPPLELTGERTLPDVPAENYWFRRHEAVYEWIAARCEGLEVIDMACGEGYGSAMLARRARHVTGVDANPRAHEHARLKYERFPVHHFSLGAREREAKHPRSIKRVNLSFSPGGEQHQFIQAERAHARARRSSAVGQPLARARVRG